MTAVLYTVAVVLALSMLAGLVRVGRGPTAADRLSAALRLSSTGVGLLQWGAATLAGGEPLRYESAPAGGGIRRIRDALRSIFP